MRTRLKRLIGGFIATLLFVGVFAGCTPQNTPAATQTQGPSMPPAAQPGEEADGVVMKSGTYTGVGWGFSVVEQLPVHVTVSEKRIEDIKIDENNGETPPILQTVTDYMIPRVLKNQSINVDAITGATISSAAFRVALTDALQQALDAGETGKSASSVFGKTVTYTPGTPETIDVDVVVVGMGGTGSAAAMRVAETQKAAGHKVSVLALEKAARYGGTSALTSHMMAINPPNLVQKLHYGEDFVAVKDVDAFRNRNVTPDLQGTSRNDIANAFWEVYKARSGELLDWLMLHGFVFTEPRRGGLFGAMPVVFDYGGTFGGNKDLIAVFFNSMIRDYVALGGKYMLETEGYELIYDASRGAVTGVKARNVVDGTEYTINAKAVILGTGGFGGNPDMVRKYNSNGYAYRLVGSGQNTGEMVASAWSIGAGSAGDEEGMNVHNAAPISIIRDFPVVQVEGWDYWTGRPATWSLNDVPLLMVTNKNTLFIGVDGTRYARESDMWPWWQGGERYYSIFSEKQIQEYKEKGFDHSHTGLFFNFGYNAFPLNTPVPEMDAIMAAGINAGCIVKAATLKELAQQLDIADPSKLEEAVARYNGLCEKGVDEDFNKPAEYLWAPGNEGPFYAVIGAAYNYSSSGGLSINEFLEVTKADGSGIINGLYAGGQDALAYVPSGFGGDNQTWSYMSGYCAAENAVKKLYS